MATYQIDEEKVIHFLQAKLSSMRSGRINASILEPINVEAYGTHMKIQELATITIPEPAQLLITPFDKSLIQTIVKAISQSSLGVNPVDDGAGIRLTFPPLTEEIKLRRIKDIGAALEEARIMVRNLRQDVLKSAKNAKENGDIPEDEFNRIEKAVQTQVDNLNKKLQDMARAKEEEIMKV